MDPCKSQQEEFLLVLYDKLFADMMLKYPNELSHLRRDMKTICDRVHAEGVSFLTKTLPKLGKALVESLETGTFLVPREFKRSHDYKNLPAFLQSMFVPLFTRFDSLADADPYLIQDILQICFLVYKYELPFSKSQENVVLHNFLKTEKDLRSVHISREDNTIVTARDIVSTIFKPEAPEREAFDPKEIVPRHGPGAVATGEKVDKKWLFSRLYNRIHQRYPYYEYFVAGGATELADRKEWYLKLDRIESGTAKVVLVPKDSRGPRLISCEPLEYQWIQQGLGRKIVRHLESHRLTKGQINFTDQTVNGQLALESSSHGWFATLDLKDASDRVTCELVEAVFPDFLVPYLMACRTNATKMPNGQVVELCKYAPMGSALCFPVEAVCFWALSVAAILEQDRSVTLAQAASQVFVYGDDIICPTIYFEAVTSTLERFGLLVNRAKSFRRGKFRESCGVDAFNGVDITVTKLRTLFTGKPTDASAYASFVSYANAFQRKGYENVARFLWAITERTYGKIPYGVAESSYPCRIESSRFRAIIKNFEYGFRMRENANTQSVTVLARYVKAHKSPTTVDSWPRLLRNFVSGQVEDPSVVVHPRSTKIQSGWRRI